MNPATAFGVVRVPVRIADLPRCVAPGNLRWVFPVLASILVVSAVHAQTFDPLQGQVHRANLGRTGVHLTTGVPSAPTVMWQFPTGGPVRSSPVVVGGVVYVGSHDGNVYAINAATGVQVWAFPTGGKVTGSAAVTGGVVYIASEAGYAYAIDAATGSQIWRYATGTLTAGSPAIVNGMVVIGRGNPGGSEFAKMTASPMVALNRSTGTQIWANSSGPQGITAIATDGSYLYANNANGANYGVYSPANGSTIYNAVSANLSFPWTSLVVSGTRFYVPRGPAGTLHCFKVGATKTLLLQNGPYPTNVTMSVQVGGSYDYAIMADIAVTDTFVLMPCINGKLYAFGASNGVAAWDFTTGGMVLGSPSVAANIVYFGSSDSYLYALNAADGTQRWRHNLGNKVNSSPWPADDAVYVGCDDGNIYALH